MEHGFFSGVPITLWELSKQWMRKQEETGLLPLDNLAHCVVQWCQSVVQEENAYGEGNRVCDLSKNNEMKLCFPIIDTDIHSPFQMSRWAAVPKETKGK